MITFEETVQTVMNLVREKEQLQEIVKKLAEENKQLRDQISQQPTV